MSLHPPPKWALYRDHVRIGPSSYHIPPGWCVIITGETVKVIGPRRDDSLALDSAVDVGVLRPLFDPGWTQPAGSVQDNWFWNRQKGLLTTEELQAGETGVGETLI